MARKVLRDFKSLGSITRNNMNGSPNSGICGKTKYPLEMQEHLPEIQDQTVTWFVFSQSLFRHANLNSRIAAKNPSIKNGAIQSILGVSYVGCIAIDAVREIIYIYI